MDDDPELERVTELLAAERTGTIDDAGREELALYDGQADLVERARARVPALISPGSATGHDAAWLARVQADEALVQANRDARARLERGLGVVMIGGGWLLATIGSVVGVVVAGAGVALVLGSFIRVRLANRRDPYEKIER